MKVKRTLIICAALFVLFIQGVGGEKPLTLIADYATYYNPSDSTTYIEFYYGLYRHQLGFVGSDENDHLYAGVLISARVFDQSGDEVEEVSTYFLSQMADDSDQENAEIRLFDYLPIRISPGYYRVELSAIDDVSKATGKTNLLATVPDYSPSKLASSDMELAYEIRDVSDKPSEAVNSRLIKEGRLVIPNPTGVYQPDVDTVLYVYSELYGLSPSSPADNGFIVNYMVKDSLGNIIHDFGQMISEKPGNSAVLANALDIRNLNSGRYFLFLKATDPVSGQTAIATKRFSLLNPASVAATLTNEDIQLMMDIAWYHLSEAEKMQVVDLTDAGKANLIRQFWRDKDDDPSNPENPFYDEAVRRFVYANDNFSTRNDLRNGWRTDRGRVHIMYGPYDEWYEEAMGAESFPYYKWTYYELEGGCIFVFVNDFVAGAVDYRLVHSTHPREKYDPKWKDILDTEDTEKDDWENAGDKDF